MDFDATFPEAILSSEERMVLERIQKAYASTLNPLTTCMDLPIHKISVTDAFPPEEGLVCASRNIGNGSLEYRLFNLDNPDEIVKYLVLRTLRTTPYQNLPIKFHSPIRTHILSVNDV